MSDFNFQQWSWASLILPITWLWHRLNRINDVAEKIISANQKTSESVARLETHQEHILKSLSELHARMDSRRERYRNSNSNSNN